MFNFHLPEALYEHLPKLYLIVAGFLILTDLSPLKWVAVVSLVLAALLTHQRRRAYRARRSGAETG